MSTTLMRWRSLAWVLPALVLLLVFVYYPIVDNLRLSLFSWNAFSVAPTFVGLDNYRTAFHDPIFWTALRNNTVFAIVSLVFQVGFALVLAALLEEFVHAAAARHPPHDLLHPRRHLDHRRRHPVLVPLQPRDRPREPPARGRGARELAALVARRAGHRHGQHHRDEPVAVHRLHRDPVRRRDPADPARSSTRPRRSTAPARSARFFSVTVPMVREMTTLIIILTISGAFLVFNEVMVMTAGGPSNSSQVLGTWLYRNAFLNDDMGYASAIATVIFVITLAIGCRPDL